MGSQECCIYRVPSPLREVKPDAYTPRILLIGPLHHSAKPKVYNGDIEANILMEDLKNGSSRYLEYLMMEDQKKRYIVDFQKRGDEDMVEKMRKIIEGNLRDIRGSYAVSTDWISCGGFIELILHDSIFILELSFKHWEKRKPIHISTSQVPKTVTGFELTVDNTYFTSMVITDLMLLENQIPYFILEKLFKFVKIQLAENPTLNQVILHLFSLPNQLISSDTKFKHFTDMYRCVYEESLKTTKKDSRQPTNDISNADKLFRSGVKFANAERDYSLAVSFVDGCLSMSIPADGSTDIVLRNVVAYEQCHHPREAWTSEFIYLINLLVTSDKDVDILTASGVISNDIGRSSLVVEMINMLGVGVITPKTTIYHSTATELRTHYNSWRHRSCATLKRVYFSDLWTGTASLAAGVLLLLTIVATGATLYQAIMTKTEVLGPGPPVPSVT